MTGDEQYPRFPVLIEAFRREWRELVAFVAEESLGTIKIDQCQLTYINQIPKGEGWELFSELEQVFSVLKPASPNGLLSNPEVISWSGGYQLPKGQGRFRAEMSPAFRSRDFKFVLTLSLQARGAPLGGSEEQVFSWFDLAHEWVVRGFDELTDPKMHAFWKRQS